MSSSGKGKGKKPATPPREERSREASPQTGSARQESGWTGSREEFARESLQHVGEGEAGSSVPRPSETVDRGKVPIPPHPDPGRMTRQRMGTQLGTLSRDLGPPRVQSRANPPTHEEIRVIYQYQHDLREWRTYINKALVQSQMPFGDDNYEQLKRDIEAAIRYFRSRQVDVSKFGGIVDLEQVESETVAQMVARLEWDYDPSIDFNRTTCSRDWRELGKSRTNIRPQDEIRELKRQHDELAFAWSLFLEDKARMRKRNVDIDGHGALVSRIITCEAKMSRMNILHRFGGPIRSRPQPSIVPGESTSLTGIPAASANPPSARPTEPRPSSNQPRGLPSIGQAQSSEGPSHQGAISTQISPEPLRTNPSITNMLRKSPQQEPTMASMGPGTARADPPRTDPAHSSWGTSQPRGGASRSSRVDSSRQSTTGNVRERSSGSTPERQGPSKRGRGDRPGDGKRR